MFIDTVHSITSSTRVLVRDTKGVPDFVILNHIAREGKAPMFHFGTSIRRSDDFSGTVVTEDASVVYWTD